VEATKTKGLAYLSELSVGGPPAQKEVQALATMSHFQLAEKMDRMTREQMDAYLANLRFREETKSTGITTDSLRAKCTRWVFPRVQQAPNFMNLISGEMQRVGSFGAKPRARRAKIIQSRRRPTSPTA
jgi:hypothetical protein